MFQQMKKRIKNEKGLTLIELLAVIVILAIIAAIAIPAIGNIISNSKDKAILSDASSLLAGAKIAIVDGACSTGTDGAITCDKVALTDVFEGELDDGDTVVLSTDTNGKKIYTITYSRLEDVKNETKFSTDDYAAKTTSITEAQLLAVMSK